MLTRGPSTKQIPIKIVGGNKFGRYPDISLEKSYNMFVSDDWFITYPGYKQMLPASVFGGGNEGRGLHSSAKLNKMISVVNNNVYLIDISFDQLYLVPIAADADLIGTLQTSTGPVFIAENNTPQIIISDNVHLYLYDATLTPSFRTVPDLDFVPGYIDFHDTYFLVAARNTSIWRLSESNNGLSFPNDAQHVGALETKADNVVAVVRFPSKGNMIFVMGETVCEPWFDVGAALFPYQRNNSYNIDYGCLNPATIASLDSIVVWLAVNEKSGPVIMYSNGQSPIAISTDGIDALLSNLQTPEDSQGFMFRQDGHIFYHINFYSDNFSLFYDFNVKLFYFATDENMNYFIASDLAYLNNQYYFVSKNNGNLYALDTQFTTYDGAEIPRIRVIESIRMPTQDRFVINDVGFTIETGDTQYEYNSIGPVNYATEAGELYITETGEDTFLILENDGVVANTPRVDLSISRDSGDVFSSYAPQILPPIGQRANKLVWWQLGAANDVTCQFRFWGIGRFVAHNGVINLRI